MTDRKLGQNQKTTHAKNRALILRLIQRYRRCSRASLSKEAGLQPTTVTYIVNDLIRFGVVEESGIITGEKGRRSIGIEISPSKYAVLGIRLTRRGFSLAIFNLRGELAISKDFTNKNIGNPNDSIDDLIDSVVEMVKASASAVLCISLAVPGPFDTVNEEIVLMTGAIVWDLRRIRNNLEERLNLPVMMTHDANAGALAQLWTNPSLPTNNTIVYVSVGQGVGCGVIVNGEILQGNLGFAGEIGHMSINYDGYECSCGNRGCLERYTSSTALTSIVNSKYGLSLSFREIAEEIKEGNPDFLSEYKQCCQYLGRGIVNVINCFNPEYIILGDEITKIDPDLLVDIVSEEVKEHTLVKLRSTTNIMADKSGKDAELFGAGVVAINYVYSHIASLMD